MDFQQVQSADAEELSVLATRIVKDYYDSIIGAQQNDYMLKKFQTTTAIQEQLSHGYSFFFAQAEGRNVGFLGYYLREDHLYLSKLYLDKQERGKGYGKKMLEFVVFKAKELQLHAIELNVNKYNPSTKIYEAMGMTRIRSEKLDIGGGYFMDDYVYRLEF